MAGPNHAAELENLVITHRRVLVRAIAPRIPARLRGLVCAEDVIQEASLEAMRCIGSFRNGGSGSLHGWVWFLAALPGCMIGIKLRPRFGLSRE